MCVLKSYVDTLSTVHLVLGTESYRPTSLLNYCVGYLAYFMRIDQLVITSPYGTDTRYSESIQHSSDQIDRLRLRRSHSPKAESHFLSYQRSQLQCLLSASS